MEIVDMIFFSLLTTAFSCIIYGIIVTAVIMTILYFLLKGLSKGIVQTIPFYITGVVLAFLLSIQLSLMIGAIETKDAADAAEIYLTQFLEGKSGVVGAQDSQRIFDIIEEEFPIIGTYINLVDFTGHDISVLAETMHATIIDYLNSYIWHRVWWILGIIVVACLIVMLFDKRSPSVGDTRYTSRRAVSRTNYDDF